VVQLAALATVATLAPLDHLGPMPSMDHLVTMQHLVTLDNLLQKLRLIPPNTTHRSARVKPKPGPRDQPVPKVQPDLPEALVITAKTENQDPLESLDHLVHLVPTEKQDPKVHLELQALPPQLPDLPVQRVLLAVLDLQAHLENLDPTERTVVQDQWACPEMLVKKEAQEIQANPANLAAKATLDPQAHATNALRLVWLQAINSINFERTLLKVYSAFPPLFYIFCKCKTNHIALNTANNHRRK